MAIKVRNNLDLGKFQLLNAALQNIAGDASAPSQGQVWLDTAGDRLKLYDGAVVQQIANLDDIGAAGGGDMLKSTYDPQTINGDAFARANMTGTQTASTISDLAATVATLDADSVDGNDAVTLLARANHTGTQLAATISDFDTAADARVQVGIDNLVDAAPGTLDTLNELAAALGDDPNFATTVSNDLATKTGKFATDIGDGAATTIGVNHALGSTDVTVAIREVSTGDMVLADWSIVDANNLNVIFGTPPASNQYRVVVIG